MKPSSRRFSFNIIDFLLIALMAAAAFALIYLFTRPDSSAGTSEEQGAVIEYRITLPSVREEFQGKAGIGDAIWLSGVGTDLGEVVNVTYSDATVMVIDKENGKQVIVADPGRLTMTLTIRANAEMNDGFYRINGFEIQLGKKIGFCLPGFTGSGSVSYLHKTEELPGGEISD